MSRFALIALGLALVGCSCAKEEPAARAPLPDASAERPPAATGEPADLVERAPRFEPPRFAPPQLGSPSATPELDARALAIRVEPLPAPFAQLKRAAKPKGPSAWLLTQAETGQSYAEFIAAQRPLPGRTIYLTTAGTLDAANASLARDVEALTRAYFQLPVKLLPAIPAELASAKAREHLGATQWLTHSILDALEARRPRDAVAFMALTQTDLYPAPEWNFLFGQARYRTRVGVTSTARHGDLARERALVLRRAFAISSHELGHMFGIKHCVAWECAMNGMLNRLELDLRPLEPCPSCLAKLHAAIGFDPHARWRALAARYAALGLGDAALEVTTLSRAVSPAAASAPP